MSDSDEELVARLRAGDPEALRGLYRRYAGPVLTVARAYVADRATADDIVQQTFLNAWRAAPTIEPGRHLSPWLYQIARHCAVDALRRSARTPGPVQTAGDATSELAALDAPTFEQTWEAFEVRRALDALPDAEREVVRLAQLGGLTHPEIAARLGVPVGTVKSRLGRAYRRLEGLLHHLAPDANQAITDDVQEAEG